MRTCSQCGQPLDDDATRCRLCGSTSVTLTFDEPEKPAVKPKAPAGPPPPAAAPGVRPSREAQPAPPPGTQGPSAPPPGTPGPGAQAPRAQAPSAATEGTQAPPPAAPAPSAAPWPPAALQPAIQYARTAWNRAQGLRRHPLFWPVAGTAAVLVLAAVLWAVLKPSTSSEPPPAPSHPLAVEPEVVKKFNVLIDAYLPEKLQWGRDILTRRIPSRFPEELTLDLDRAKSEVRYDDASRTSAYYQTLASYHYFSA